MWRNYFTAALRNISKNRIFTLINVSGLAIAMASTCMIAMFILREFSYDRFNVNADRICRLYIDGGIGDQNFRGAWTSMVMAPTFTSEIPEIEQFVRFDVFNQQLVWYDGEKHIEDNFLFADSTLFDIFTIHFKEGDPATALSRPKSVVITTLKAREYFGDRDPLGKYLTLNTDSNYYTVTGVIEPLPENSHYYADFIASMSTLEYSREETWFENSIFSYVLLARGADRKKVEEKMASVMVDHIRSELQAFLGVDPEEWEAGGNRYGVYLQPLKDIHLQPDIETGLEICFKPVNDKKYIYIFSLIALFILAIACINFMNLATARAVTRTREIGLRKVMGSDRKLLVRQFLSESVILSMISLVFAMILVELALPWFNRTMNLDLRIDRSSYLYLTPGFLVVAVVIGLLSGLYPALFMSRFNPVEGFKGNFPGDRRASLLRSLMVVVQFTISIAIIVGTLIVSFQVNYLLHKDLGYDKDQLLVLKRIYPLEHRIQAFCRELEKIPGIAAASNSTTYLGFNNSSETYQIEGRKASENFLFGTNYVDYDFMNTYQFSLIPGKGRFFDPSCPEDTSAILVNEAAVRDYHITDPFGTMVLEPTFEGDTNKLRIIGIMEDFHHSSLYEPVEPYMLRFKKEDEGWAGFISVRLGVAGKGLPSTLRKIKETWMDWSGEAPFQYFFLNDELDNYYKEEHRTGRLSMMFAILATFIACLGLFGLTLHSTQRKTHEIGIRKAMGASIREVVLYVSKEIILLVLISVLLAWIASYFFMQHWLQDFPYNIGFRPWIYLISALCAIVISMATVFTLAYRAALSNPADVLHYE